MLKINILKHIFENHKNCRLIISTFTKTGIVSLASLIGLANCQLTLAQVPSSSSQLHAQININLNQVKVPEIAQKIIQAINKTELTGDFSGAVKTLGISDINQSPIINRIEQSKKAHDYLVSIGELYKNFKSQFKIQNLNVTGTSASLDVQEYTEIELSKPEDIAAGIIPKYIKNHRFTFTISGGQIKLTSHKLLNDPSDPDPLNIKNAVPAPPDAIPATIGLVDPKFRKFVSTIVASSQLTGLNADINGSVPSNKFVPQINKIGVLNFNLISSMMVNLISANYTTYNRSAAVDYAGKYWQSFNPKYRNFEQVFGFINQGDCTNYASQALLEGGGWTSIDGARPDNNVWWYNPNPAIPVSQWADSQSYTWASAPNFYQFLKNHPERAKPVNQSSLLRAGDIVHVDFNKGEGLSHTMIVTFRRDDGMIFLAGHTKPHYMMPIYDIQANYPGAKFYTWQLQNEFLDPNGFLTR
jgi:Putative amidase domain